MGQESYQVTGTATLVKAEIDIPEEDVQMVVEQTGASLEVAREVLVECEGDLAQAITRLQDNNTV